MTAVVKKGVGREAQVGATLVRLAAMMVVVMAVVVGAAAAVLAAAVEEATTGAVVMEVVVVRVARWAAAVPEEETVAAANRDSFSLIPLGSQHFPSASGDLPGYTLQALRGSILRLTDMGSAARSKAPRMVGTAVAEAAVRVAEEKAAVLEETTVVVVEVAVIQGRFYRVLSGSQHSPSANEGLVGCTRRALRRSTLLSTGTDYAAHSKAPRLVGRAAGMVAAQAELKEVRLEDTRDVLQVVIAAATLGAVEGSMASAEVAAVRVRGMVVVVTAAAAAAAGMVHAAFPW